MPTLGVRPHVVIVGGGFGGLYAAKALRSSPVRITLLDRRNHHLFQPLLYQVATAALNPSNVAMPLRAIFRHQRNVTVLMAEATRVDVDAGKVILREGEISYDYLILAAGATHSYFGNDMWSRHAPGLKTIEDALEIRRRVLTAFEAAERESDAGLMRELLTFVIVGAGPTGVELAGALAEITRHALAKDFRNFDPRQARVILLEGASRVLPTFPPDLSDKAREQLARLNVDVMTKSRVTGIAASGVTIGNSRIQAKTVIWAAGVVASPLARSLGTPLDRAGRVLVKQDLTLPGHPKVFIIGDVASVMQDGQLIPAVAPAAVQMGRHAAGNIRRAIRGDAHRPFRFEEAGMLATLGRGAAVAVISRSHWSGYFAWWLWLFVHIMQLVGFRNRFLVLFEWAWSFLTYQRSVRLITGNVSENPQELAD